MPPSQLKRLKASLHEQGITGPQKSKKQKKQGLSTEAKIKRNTALASIRETFNPFEVKHLSRPAKHDITTAETLNGRPKRVALGRPGVSRSLGEERRRETLLLDMQNRNKVGGIFDNRIGEDDPFMSFEEKALQRFAMEKKKKGAVFDLEVPEEEDLLTHGGRTLDFDGDDYDAGSLEEENLLDDEPRLRKRRLEELDESVDSQDGETGNDSRKKSKAEVMEEVIKKSKTFKYERQQAKEDDDEARRALDKELPDIRDALSAFQTAIEKRAEPLPKTKMNGNSIHPDRADLINGTNGDSADKTYDSQLKKLIHDQRAKPTDRTKTEEENAEEEAELLKELEENRVKRMLGIDDENEDDEEEPTPVDDGFFPEEDDAIEFGFQQRQTSIRHTRPEGIDDEDDFLIEDGLVASDDSNGDEAEISDIESDQSLEDELLALDGSYEMVNGRLKNGSSSISCPGSLEEISALFEDIPYEQYHEKIRQIRLLNDPTQSNQKRENSIEFLKALIAFLATVPEATPPPPSKTLDTMIRHIHSMARKFPDAASQTFRDHLKIMHENESMSAGDLVMLTAIGTVFPSSDHFHAIVTPATLLIARWLAFASSSSSEQSVTPSELNKGAYLVHLVLKYQERAKRHVPEAVRYTLSVLSSGKTTSSALLQPHISNLNIMTDLWSGSPAFTAIFPPSIILPLLKSAKADSKTITRITARINNAEASRRTLLLHKHRPLAIRTFVPRFEEEGFDNSKRYDPDTARAESARLRKEYKRERKSTLREFRKDARFLTREKLREKVEKDKRYEEKYRKLVAEIQGEEGRESKAYDKEKKKRRGK